MYRFEKNGEDLDIVIDGWEKGIADSPEEGIADIHNINIITTPKEAPVNFSTSAINTPPTYTSANGTFNATNDTVTYTPGSTVLYNGVSLTFTATSGGVTQNRVYWVGGISGSTFKLYDSPSSTNVVNLIDLTDNNVHVFNTIILGTQTQHFEDYLNNYNFYQDSNGRVWWINASERLVHIGPLITATGLELLTNAHGTGLCTWAGGGSDSYLFAFRDTAVDVFSVNYLLPNSISPGMDAWVQNNFAAGIVNSFSTSTTSHYAISGRDNGLYFCNKSYIGRVLVKAGSSFEPTIANSYTATGTALTLPSTDRATVLAELDINLLIGGIINAVYVWNRTDPNFNNRLILAENYTTGMVSANSNVYIFAGNRGRIYITNGSNVQLYKKFPDHISSVIDPYYTWNGFLYWKNQLYFSLTSTNNAGTNLYTTLGVWAIDLDSGALRSPNGTTGGSDSIKIIAPVISSTQPAGAGLYMAWKTSTSTYGMDITASTPYTSFTTNNFIDTDLIPVGTYYKAKTFSQIEFKLSAAAVAGEAIRISYRTALYNSWNVIDSTTFSGNEVSGAYPVNFQTSQWLQFRIELSSVSSSPSNVRLREIRIR